MISLDQAKNLVKLLEQKKQEEANALLMKITADGNARLFNEVGRLTRTLHDSIVDFQINPNIGHLTTKEIPEARESLKYVLEKTENAANRTMDAVDLISPIADNIQNSLLEIKPQWNDLMGGRIEINNFKSLCHQIDKLISQVEIDTQQLRIQSTEILMAQEFQDLTGQVIRRVIALFKEIESKLISILTSFNVEDSIDVESQESAYKAEGPIINRKQQDAKQVMQSQDDVDDLLSTLGF